MVAMSFVIGSQRSLSELTDREVLALAIQSEEEDGRIYREFAEGLKERYPASAQVFMDMAEAESGHRRMLLDLFQQRFGDHIPLVRREDVKGFSHVTMVRLAPQPAEKHALEQGGVEPVGLGPPMLAGDGHAGRVNDMSLNAVSSEPARQPEAIAASLEGDGNARDRAAGLAGLLTPAVEEVEEGILVGSEFLERMTRDPRHHPRHQPARLAHLDHRDNRMILIQRGEASVQVSWF